MTQEGQRFSDLATGVFERLSVKQVWLGRTGLGYGVLVRRSVCAAGLWCVMSQEHDKNERRISRFRARAGLQISVILRISIDNCACDTGFQFLRLQQLYLFDSSARNRDLLRDIRLLITIFIITTTPNSQSGLQFRYLFDSIQLLYN